MYKHVIFIIITLFSGLTVYSQNENEELNMLINKALENNMGLKAQQLQTEASKANMGTAYDFDKTTVYYGYDQNNYAPNDKALNVFGLEQSFSFPTVYGARRSLYKSQWEQSKALYDIERNKLIMDVSLLYEQLVYVQNKELLYKQLDSLYASFSKAGQRKFELGESNYLEKITSEAKAKQIHTNLLQLKSQKNSLYTQLTTLLQDNDSIVVANNKLELLAYESMGTIQENYFRYNDAVSKTYENQLKLNRQNWFPDLTIELYTGTNKGLGYMQNGVQVGIGIPLFFNGNVAKNKTAKLEMQSWQAQRVNKERKMNDFIIQKTNDLKEHKEMINYYNQNGRTLSEELMKTAEMSYKNGEIDFFQYIQSLENAISIHVDYLESVLAYNKSYLEMYYFNFTE